MDDCLDDNDDWLTQQWVQEPDTDIGSTTTNTPKKRVKGKKRKFYAVSSGRQPGIFDEWNECEKQTKGFPAACFKSFPTKEQAEEWFVEQRLPYLTMYFK